MHKIKLLYISLIFAFSSNMAVASNLPITIDTIVKSVVNGDFATSEAIIVFKDGVNLDDAMSKIRNLFSQNGMKFEKYHLINAIHFKVPSVAFDTIKSTIENSSLKDLIEVVDKNYKVSIASQTNDTNYNKLWAIENDGQSVNGTSGVSTFNIP